MATPVPQRKLRNETASLLRRVEMGERLRITVNGHPVADLVPLERGASFVSRELLLRELRGTITDDPEIWADIRTSLDGAVRELFE